MIEEPFDENGATTTKVSSKARPERARGASAPSESITNRRTVAEHPADDQGELRGKIARLLAAALESDRAHVAELDRQSQLHIAETERRDQLHIAEAERRDALHHAEMQRRQDTFDHDLATIRDALETRELIGEAKGVIIATMGCASDAAFVLLRNQSQAENRKLHDVAAEVVATAQRRAHAPRSALSSRA